jgi:hypothetical protein
MNKSDLEEIGVGILAGVIFVFLLASIFFIAITLINNVNNRLDTTTEQEYRTKVAKLSTVHILKKQPSL